MTAIWIYEGSEDLDATTFAARAFSACERYRATGRFHHMPSGRWLLLDLEVKRPDGEDVRDSALREDARELLIGMTTY